MDLKFEFRYLVGDTPWDSGISPPELLEFLDTHEPGRALEFGCGTGTNALTLARHGWQVDAIDLSWIAVQRARRKARRSRSNITFIRADVTRAGQHNSITPPYELALDIGCFHALEAQDRQKYARQLPNLVKRGGVYLLYSFLDQGQPDRRNWPKEQSIMEFYQPNFSLVHVQHGHYQERPSAWFKFKRRS